MMNAHLSIELAQIGLALTPLLMLSLGYYMGHHYTRVPGGGWTTWEKALSRIPEAEAERAA